MSDSFSVRNTALLQTHLALEEAVNLHAAYKSVTIAICDTVERASEKYPSIPAYSDDADYRGTSVKFTYEKLKLHFFSKNN